MSRNWLLKADFTVCVFVSPGLPNSPNSFSYRGSYGVGKEGAMVPLATRSRYAFAHFCCYLPYFVHVTFATLQRNGPFFQICCKLQHKIDVFPPKVVSGPDSLRKSSEGRLRAIWGLALGSSCHLCTFLQSFSSVWLQAYR